MEGLKMIDKEELLQLLKNKYGSLENDKGCYIFNDDKNCFDSFLSVKAIVDIINECTEYSQ